MTVALDLATKTAATQFATVRAFPFVQLVANPSYTMGAGGDAGWLLPLISAAALILVGWWLRPLIQIRAVHPVPVGLLLGGGAGNLLDRVFNGAVTDFLAVPGLIINLADIAVLAGMVTFLITGGGRHLLHRSNRFPAERRYASSRIEPQRSASPRPGTASSSYRV